MQKPYVSFLILTLLVGVSFFGAYIYPYSSVTFDADAILLPPSFTHLFGTDRLGRDVLARIIEGGQISLIVGVGSALIASLIGLVVGISAGLFKKGVDKAIIVVIDLFLTFPTFFLLLALIAYVQASVMILIIVISITGWMGMARLIRSESFEIASKPFIKILLLAKVPKYIIFFKYFLPLLFPIFLISFTFGVSGAILAESGLSFLGLGVLPPQMSWGSILSEGKEVLDVAWWLSFFPGLMIFGITFALLRISNYLQYYFNAKNIHQK